MPLSNPNQPFPLLHLSMLFEAAVVQRGIISWAVRTVWMFHIYTETLSSVYSSVFLKILQPKSVRRVSLVGNESWLNWGTCIKLMLNSYMLHSPSSGATHMSQPVVFNYGLVHIWLFPLHTMAIPSTTGIPACHMFWKTLYFYENMQKAVSCHGWWRI